MELAPETYKENNELTSITPGLGQIKSGYGNQIARKRLSSADLIEIL